MVSNFVARDAQPSRERSVAARLIFARLLIYLFGLRLPGDERAASRPLGRAASLPVLGRTASHILAGGRRPARACAGRPGGQRSAASAWHPPANQHGRRATGSSKGSKPGSKVNFPI